MFPSYILIWSSLFLLLLVDFVDWFSVYMYINGSLDFIMYAYSFKHRTFQVESQTKLVYCLCMGILGPSHHIDSLKLHPHYYYDCSTREKCMIKQDIHLFGMQYSEIKIDGHYPEIKIQTNCKISTSVE